MKANKLHTCFLMLLLASCSSSRITHSWKADSFPDKVYNRILVTAIVPNDERNLRAMMENHFAGDLTSRGYTSISALKEYGAGSFLQMNEEEVVSQLHNSRVDAVITIVLLDKKRERYYVPARVYYSPYAVYHNRFWGYYSTLYGRINGPGYYQTDTRYFWECNFYDQESKQLLYSVQTESFDPGSVETLAHEFGEKITADMKKKGLIK
jgi:hypothetical protein